MKQLHLGYMSSKELAEWSNLTETHIKKQKTKWCSNKLSKYAKFNMVRNGVVITEIIEPVYLANTKALVEQAFNEIIKDTSIKIVNCREMAEEIQKRYSTLNIKSIKTIENYVGDINRSLPEKILQPITAAKIINDKKSYGVYAIYADDKIIYIGSTIRTFDIRFAEHQQAIKDLKQPQLDVYNLIRIFQEAGQTITYKPLIDCSKLQTNKTLTTHDIESMELALIQEHQPVGNIAGLTKPFLYHAVSEPTDGV